MFDRFYLLLHSFEFVFMLWIFIWVFSLSEAWIAVAVGMSQHLVLDRLTNPLRIGGYFFLYRLVHGFKKEFVIDMNMGLQCRH